MLCRSERWHRGVSFGPKVSRWGLRSWRTVSGRSGCSTPQAVRLGSQEYYRISITLLLRLVKVLQECRRPHGTIAQPQLGHRNHSRNSPVPVLGVVHTIFAWVPQRNWPSNAPRLQLGGTEETATETKPSSRTRIDNCFRSFKLSGKVYTLRLCQRKMEGNGGRRTNQLHPS